MLWNFQKSRVTLRIVQFVRRWMSFNLTDGSIPGSGLICSLGKLAYSVQRERFRTGPNMSSDWHAQG
jgi:hypothetical protein